MDSNNTFHALRMELRASQAKIAHLQEEKEQLEATTNHLNFLDNAIDGFFFTDMQNDILFINLYMLRMLGYADVDRQALIGEPLPKLHWQNPNDMTLILRELEQEGFIRELKVGLQALNGTPFYVNLTAVVTRDEQGQMVGAQYTVRLLPQSSMRGTAELRAENRELGALTAIGRNVMSTMSVGEVVQHLLHTVCDFFEVNVAWVYLLNKDGTRRLGGHTGLDEEQLLSVQSAVDHFFDLRRFSDSRRPRLISTRNAQTGMLIARSIGLSNLAIAPLLSHEETIGLIVLGSRSNIFLIDTDMMSLERIAQYAGLALSNAILYADLQQAYEELKHAQEQLVEAERQKVVVEMAGAAAHELNQPLTVLLGYANLLGRTLQDDDPQKAIYEKIERSTRKISEVVERLGQITRYRTRPYVEGQGIIDIQAASRPELPRQSDRPTDADREPRDIFPLNDRDARGPT